MQYSHYISEDEFLKYINKNAWAGSGIFSFSQVSGNRSSIAVCFRHSKLLLAIHPVADFSNTPWSTVSEWATAYRIQIPLTKLAFEADLLNVVIPSELNLQLQALDENRAHLTVQNGPVIYFSGIIQRNSRFSSAMLLWKYRSLFAVLDTGVASGAIVSVYDFHHRSDRKLR